MAIANEPGGTFQRPYVISWNLTYRCNLACEHCYLDAGGKPLVREESFADRSDRYRLVILVQILMGLIALGLGLVDFADGESIGVVYLFTGALGFVATFDNPARRTLATELVPADQLANIVALSTSVMVGSRITGPALDFCLVATQRRHVDDTSLVVVGDAAADWMRVAQAFAGPPTDGPVAR